MATVTLLKHRVNITLDRKVWKLGKRMARDARRKFSPFVELLIEQEKQRQEELRANGR